MFALDRRMFLGVAALCAGRATASLAHQPRAQMNNLKIRDVRVIVTQPTTRLIVVKVETSEPELHGLGWQPSPITQPRLQPPSTTICAPFFAERTPPTLKTSGSPATSPLTGETAPYSVML